MNHEDNDPTGYKSKKAIAAKGKWNITAISWPKYSPDLHPLDFSIWDTIEREAIATAPLDGESVIAFKKRLRNIAVRMPEHAIRKAIESMPRRIAQVVKAKGGHARRD